ncbi:MAG: hypothetical protein DYH12_27060 [Sorangiineae bacterium PRO1]|nr:hypothetical protein [Sorangiineae bacterium PRO1]
MFDPTPCLGGGNIVVFDGQSGDYIHPTDDVVTQGKWSASHDANQVKISVTPSDPKQGIVWYLDFNSNALSAPLGLGVYLDAERGPFASPGHPGLEIYGDGKGCNKLSGRFQIYQLDTSCGLSFTASFEQSCETTFPVLRGCVHYQQ